MGSTVAHGAYPPSSRRHISSGFRPKAGNEVVEGTEAIGPPMGATSPQEGSMLAIQAVATNEGVGSATSAPAQTSRGIGIIVTSPSASRRIRVEASLIVMARIGVSEVTGEANGVATRRRADGASGMARDRPPGRRS